MNNDSLIGRQIDQYRILRHLARGGMADVYLAEDVDLQRKVALKVMLDALAASDPQFAERFRREAITVAKLDHPNIVQVYTVGQTPAGQPYIAMQYIEGGSLQEKLAELADRKKLLTTEQTLNVARQIALALAAAHKAGIVHRDLKPANVLIRPDGTPVLVDLGIAAVQGGAKLTQTGSVIGTPAYMSPEQVRGVPLDGRADLYSLGIMLYEMLTGIRPFDGDSSIAVLHQQVYEEPLPLDKFRPDLRPPTVKLVETALQKDPARRYQSAQEMVQAVDRAIQAEGLSGPNPGVTAVLTQMSDSKLLSRGSLIRSPGAARKEWPAWVWGVALLSLSAVVIFAFFAFRSSKESPVTALAATNTAVSLPPSGLADNSTTDDYSTVISQTETPVNENANNTNQPEIIPSATIPPTDVPPTPANTATPLPTATAVNLFPDGLIAYSCETDNGNQIYLNTPEGSNQFLLSNQPGNSIVPAFSPDGRQIAYRSNAAGSWQIYLSGVDGSNRQQVTTGNGNNFEAAWSPDGSQLIFVSDRDGTKQIYVMNKDGSNQRRLTNNDAYNDDPSWSVNNQIVYESNVNGRYSIFQLPAQGGIPTELIAWGDSSSTPAWSPDGQWVAFESREGEERHIWIARKDGSEVTQITTQGDNNQRPAWSPDGTKIAFHSNYQQLDSTQADIWVIDIATKMLQRITFQGNCYNPAWASTPTIP